MKKFPLVISVINFLIGVIASWVLYENTRGVYFLIGLFDMIYSAFIFFSVFKFENFIKDYEFTLKLFIWSTTIILGISFFTLIGFLIAGVDKGVWIGILIAFFGGVVASIISLVGFVLDYSKNKN